VDGKVVGVMGAYVVYRTERRGSNISLRYAAGKEHPPEKRSRHDGAADETVLRPEDYAISAQGSCRARSVERQLLLGVNQRLRDHPAGCRMFVGTSSCIWRGYTSCMALASLKPETCTLRVKLSANLPKL